MVFFANFELDCSVMNAKMASDTSYMSAFDEFKILFWYVLVYIVWKWASQVQNLKFDVFISGGLFFTAKSLAVLR
jgi:hypothetical protein